MQEFRKGDKVMHEGQVCYYRGTHREHTVIQVPRGEFNGEYGYRNELPDPISGYKYYGITKEEMSNLQLVSGFIQESKVERSGIETRGLLPSIYEMQKNLTEERRKSAIESAQLQTKEMDKLKGTSTTLEYKPKRLYEIL